MTKKQQKRSKNPDTREMVNYFLIDNGFGGLYNEYIGCACGFDDLIQCGEIRPDCKAGYEVKAHCRGHDFHIQSTKRRSKNSVLCCTD